MCAAGCRCTQRHTVRNMPVYVQRPDGCDRIVMDKFLLPSHCDCMCLPGHHMLCNLTRPPPTTPAPPAVAVRYSTLLQWPLGGGTAPPAWQSSTLPTRPIASDAEGGRHGGARRHRCADFAAAGVSSFAGSVIEAASAVAAVAAIAAIAAIASSRRPGRVARAVSPEPEPRSGVPVAGAPPFVYSQRDASRWPLWRPAAPRWPLRRPAEPRWPP